MREVIIWILILIFVDQLIKMLIYSLLEDVRFEIIPNLIEFKPTFNTKHSWVNTLIDKNFGINIGLIPHILIYLSIAVIIPMYFTFLRGRVSKDKKLIDTATIFMTFAIVCALIGNLIWTKGTLRLYLP